MQKTSGEAGHKAKSSELLSKILPKCTSGPNMLKLLLLFMRKRISHGFMRKKSSAGFMKESSFAQWLQIEVKVELCQMDGF